MRLRDIEDKLSTLVQSRWPGSGVFVYLHEHSRPTLSIVLPDDTELSTAVQDHGSLLVEAFALLARHLEALPSSEEPPPAAPGRFAH